MTDHIIIFDTQDPFIRALANLTDAGLDPIVIDQWPTSEREAA